MQLKCVAIDDEPLALYLVKTYTDKLPELNLAATFDNAISAGEFLRQNKTDLVFIDVNMPHITGIDLVRSLDPRPLIIFTTAYKKFAFDGFELDAVDYLLKPFSFERFQKAVQKAIQMAAQQQAATSAEIDHIFIRSEYKMIRILLADVEYMEGVEDYVKIHLANARPLMTLMTLQAMQDKLPDGFLRIHRSYIIPLRKIKALLNRKVELTGGAVLPVGDSYAAALQNRIKGG